MSTAARPLLRYLVATGGALIGASALTHGLLGTSYAGASDDTAVRTGMALYGGYLRDIGLWIVLLVSCQMLVLSLLSSGLLVWVPYVRKPGLRAWLVLLAMSILVGTIAVGHEAHRHPGLFLPLASAGAWGVLWVEMSGIVWPLLLWASCAGFLKGFFLRTKPLERASSAIGAAFVLAALSLGGDDAQAERSRITTAYERPKRSGPARSRPNILVIGIDSLRPDKIDPENTPSLARLLTQSVYFPNTVVTLPRTGPSWTALLTSLPPLENGVETMFPSGARTD